MHNIKKHPLIKLCKIVNLAWTQAKSKRLGYWHTATKVTYKFNCFPWAKKRDELDYEIKGDVNQVNSRKHDNDLIHIVGFMPRESPMNCAFLLK